MLALRRPAARGGRGSLRAVLQSCSGYRTGTAAKPSLTHGVVRRRHRLGWSSVSAWAEPLAFVRQSVGMIAADLGKVVQPCSAAVADPQECRRRVVDASAEPVNDGGASGPSADWIEDHQAGLELRAHRCAPQRVVLTLPWGVGG